MSLSDAAPCDFLAWDSDFFGIRIGRVKGDGLTEAQAAEVDAWSRQQAIRCLYFLARVDDPVTTLTAETHGFRLVDVRVTYERRLGTAGDPPAVERQATTTVRLARPDDLPDLRCLARTGFVDTRFFYDPGFPRSLAESLYATWIERECQGWAQAVWVAASPEDQPLGVISCHLDSARAVGQIGLVGVSPQARGGGLGNALVLTALGWFAAQGATEVVVVTQGRNRSAQRLYQRCGFLTRDLQLWYHKWYPASEKHDDRLSDSV